MKTIIILILLAWLAYNIGMDCAGTLTTGLQHQAEVLNNL